MKSKLNKNGKNCGLEIAVTAIEMKRSQNCKTGKQAQQQ